MFRFVYIVGCLILSVLHVTCASGVGAGTPSVSTKGQKKINIGGFISPVELGNTLKSETGIILLCAGS